MALDNINVLVFPAATEVGLEIHRSLKDIRYITLFAACTYPGHSDFVYTNTIPYLPKLDDVKFVSHLQTVIAQYKIDVILPTTEEALFVLSNISEQLDSVIVTAPKETVKICRNKELTYQSLSGTDFLPKIFTAESIPAYPVIIKPKIGAAAIGFKKILNKKELLKYYLPERDIICEYLPGREYTVDCFTDTQGTLKYISPRERVRTKNGIAMNSHTVPLSKEIETIAEIINNTLSMRSMWFFQIKEAESGKLKLLEVATRCAGTMCINRAKGVNLPLMSILDAMNMSSTVYTNPTVDVTVDRALYNCFNTSLKYQHVYLDFDDTLIIHDKLNLTALSFIYQCNERKIPVTLLTRHNSNLYEELNKRKICSALFNQIIILTEDQHKYSFIDSDVDSLFIDDSHREKSEINTHCPNCFVLGPESIDTLINYLE